jgi:glucose-6-phosphate dehydrogenase assembly protein OpcA
MQFQIEKTLDVDEVERQLADLWKENAGDDDVEQESAVLRARVANLLVFVASDEHLNEVHELLPELTAIHPCRALILHGSRSKPAVFIELAVSTIFQASNRVNKKRLCCEEITLKAEGDFVAELPSAALPLMVSDLSTFLWWRDVVQVADKVFEKLLMATDRLVIDSAEFEDPQAELLETHKLFRSKNCDEVGISDLNWARLTFWRALLADFYDVPAYQPFLDKVDYVGIDYVGPAGKPNTVAPQALLFAGWMASRLGWHLLSNQTTDSNDQPITLRFSADSPDNRPNATDDSPSAREIMIELNRVELAERKPGRLVRVELRTKADPSTSFTVERGANNLHLITEAKLGKEVHRGRVLPVRNRTAAQLLGREMEILCNDKIYQEALALGTTFL